MRWSVVLLITMAGGCTWIDQEAYDEVRDQDGDGVSRDVDCDDGDVEVGLPGTWYADEDGDGFGAALDTVASCAAPQGYVADGSDCDDGDDEVFPGAPEVCGGRDEDCDGLVDDLDPSLGGTPPQWVPDGDGDGVPAAANATVTVGACLAPEGYVAAPGGSDPVDCDDADPDSFPGGTELCDGADNDCDGRVDEDVVPESSGSARFLVDEDGDGWPVHPSDGAGHFCADAVVPGMVAEPSWLAARDDGGLDEDSGLDCRDRDPTVHPLADDVFYDGIDSNCDGASDWDADGDGENTAFAPDGLAGEDCDDDDRTVFPGATEDCSTIDRDCTGNPYDAPATDPNVDAYLRDVDGDQWPGNEEVVELCADAALTGWMTAAAYEAQKDDHPDLDITVDCADDDPERHPSAEDIWYDGIDSNCDERSDFDADGDGEDKVIGNNGIDCDDDDPAINTQGIESCNGLDDNCNGDTDEAGGTVTYYLDDDGDHWPADLSTATLRCSPEEGWVVDSDYQLALAGAGYGPGAEVVDCDDDRAASFPGAPDLPYDGFDDDCAGDSDYDADGDGHDSTAFDGDDCDDDLATVGPHVAEVCTAPGDELVDEDCDGQFDESGGSDVYYVDADGDRWPESLDPVLLCAPLEGYVADDVYQLELVGAGYAVGDDILDCDDTRDLAYPGADDTPYDGFDDDCDEWSDYDADRDGYDIDAFGGTDCDDDVFAIHPGATEVCNGVDDDCNTFVDEAGGTDVYYRDEDEDDWPLDLTPSLRCDDDPGWVPEDAYRFALVSAGYDAADTVVDCDDTRDLSYPGADDTPYDGFDDDCDGWSDYDADRDGFDADTFDGSDCDDDVFAIHPDAAEACNGVDDDCNEQIDEAGGNVVYFLDDDDDLWPVNVDPVVRCYADPGWVAEDDYRIELLAAGYAIDDDVLDCDDTRDLAYPGADDTPYDGFDDDCDGWSDYDADRDGFDADSFDGTDCNDDVFAIHPDASEACNSVDDDCDELIDEAGGTDVYFLDDDEDFWPVNVDPVVRCYDDPGWVAEDDYRIELVAAGYAIDDDVLDCDDTRALSFPGADDTPYDGFDDDCDGWSDYDADRDGFDADTFDGTDCDDDVFAIHPDAAEACNGVDDDCDELVDEAGGTDVYFLDDDKDLWPANVDPVVRCNDDPGWVAESAYRLELVSAGYDIDDDVLDCDDTRGEAYPGAFDLPYDNLDDDCAGDSDFDADGDGHEFDAFGGSDCDDADFFVNPDQVERCTDGADPLVDENCNGEFDERGADDGDPYWVDADEDGYTAKQNAEFVKACGPADDLLTVFNGGDCDDEDPGRNPAVAEVADDGIDQDCSGTDSITCYLDGDSDGHAGDVAVVEDDGDCAESDRYLVSDDCDDNDDTIYPGAYDVCDEVDNDCSGSQDATISGIVVAGVLDPRTDATDDLSAAAVIDVSAYDEVRFCGGDWTVELEVTTAGTDVVISGITLDSLQQVPPNLQDIGQQDDTPSLQIPSSKVLGGEIPASLTMSGLVLAPDQAATFDLSGIEVVTLDDVVLSGPSPQTLLTDEATDLVAAGLTISNDTDHDDASMVLDGDASFTDLEVFGGGVEVLSGDVDMIGVEVKSAEVGVTVAANASLQLQDGSLGGNDQAAEVSGTLNLSNMEVTGDQVGLDDHVEVLSGGVLTADASVFANNVSTLGGAVYAEVGSFVVLSNTSVVSNQANYGGGLLLRGVTTIVDSSLSENTAQAGGGALLQGNSQVVATTFGGNRAEVSGGAAQYGDPGGVLVGDYGLSVVGTNGLMVGGRHAVNDAPEGGAYRIEDGADVTFEFLSADSNTASLSGGLFSVEGATVDLLTGKFVGNTAEKSGSALWVGPGATVTDCGSDWQTNGGKKGDGGAAYVAGGTLLLGGEASFTGNEAITGPLAMVTDLGTLGNATSCTSPTRLYAAGHDNPSVVIEAGSIFTATGWELEAFDAQTVLDENTGREEELPP